MNGVRACKAQTWHEISLVQMINVVKSQQHLKGIDDLLCASKMPMSVAATQAVRNVSPCLFQWTARVVAVAIDCSIAFVVLRFSKQWCIIIFKLRMLMCGWQTDMDVVLVLFQASV